MSVSGETDKLVHLPGDYLEGGSAFLRVDQPDELKPGGEPFSSVGWGTMSKLRVGID